MVQVTLKIDGMMCGMCEAHVGDAIRKQLPEARKVSASAGRARQNFFWRTSFQSRCWSTSFTGQWILSAISSCRLQSVSRR